MAQKDWRREVKAKYPNVKFEELPAAGEVHAWVDGKQVSWYDLDKDVKPLSKKATDRRGRLHDALDAVMDEKLTSVMIPGHKGNIPNKEYKIPPKPAAKDDYHFATPPKKPKPLLSVANKEDREKLSAKGGSELHKGKDDVRSLGQAIAHIVKLHGSESLSNELHKLGYKASEIARAVKRTAGAKDAACETCGYVIGHHSECPAKPKKAKDAALTSKELHAIKEVLNSGVVPKPTPQSGVPKTWGIDRRAKIHDAVDRAFDAKRGKDAGTVDPRSYRQAALPGPDKPKFTMEANGSRATVIGGLGNNRKQAIETVRDQARAYGSAITLRLMESGKEVFSTRGSVGKKTTDSENKSLSPMVKVIPRSKRPMGKDVSKGPFTLAEAKEAVTSAIAAYRAGDITYEELKKVRAELDMFKAKDSEPNPFERDTDAGAAKIVKREGKAGLSVDAIVKKYGFSKSFVEEEMPAKGKDSRFPPGKYYFKPSLGGELLYTDDGKKIGFEVPVPVGNKWMWEATARGGAKQKFKTEEAAVAWIVQQAGDLIKLAKDVSTVGDVEGLGSPEDLKPGQFFWPRNGNGRGLPFKVASTTPAKEKNGVSMTKIKTTTGESFTYASTCLLKTK